LSTETRERLQEALNRNRRRLNRPILAKRLSEAGLVASLVSDVEQEALLARFRANSLKSTGRDFPSVAEAGPWIAARIGMMPDRVVLMPNDNQEDCAPAVFVEARAALKVILETPGFPFMDGCYLFSQDGTSRLEISPNHTRDGDVITVRFWGSAPDTV
jgi:hypothetical protein